MNTNAGLYENSGMNASDEKIPFADGHCDLLHGIVNHGYDITNPRGGQAVSLKTLIEGNVRLQLFAAWIDVSSKKPHLSQFMCMADAFHTMLQNNERFTSLTPDFDPYGADGRIAAALTIEGGEAIEGYMENLRCVRRMGVRAMTLTWNTPNILAQPALKKSKRGLSPFGREVVREMTRIGMAVDVSHLNDYGIDDVLEESNARVFASHSNARSVCDSPRCLCDEHIREIARRGGTIGVNFYHKQLSKSRAPTIDDVVRHIMRIIEIGGLNCAAIGSDFDGMDRYPEGLPNPAGLQGIAKALRKNGIEGNALYRVCYGNLADFLTSL